MSPDDFRNALILTGPTGSGKSRLALELAESLDAEILAMDSMTLYRGLNIGTAKPTREECGRIPHHLLDLLDPWESASVSWWAERAVEAVRDIESRGKQALFVGGTALYLKTLLFGLFPGPPADTRLRQELEDEAQTKSKEHLHARLREVDPPSASRLHPNDVRRVVRALEVYTLTGRPISEWQTQWKSKTEDTAFPFRCLCIDLPREVLYERIDTRVDQMIDQGLVEEVRGLMTLQQSLSREARQAVGYKELIDHLEGKMSLAESVEQIKTATRQFAKRQLTWFRHLQGCEMIAPELTIERWQSRMK